MAVHDRRHGLPERLEGFPHRPLGGRHGHDPRPRGPQPPRGRPSFIPRLLAAYRSGPVAKPFNRKLKWLDKGVASWETVEPDLRYHVRHIAVPAPGTMESLSEIVSFLNSPLLDRSLPLWECYIIEGLDNVEGLPPGSFAIGETATPPALDVVCLQDDAHAGFESLIDSILRQARVHLERLNAPRLETVPASELEVGVQGGGRVAFSGVNAKPPAGRARGVACPVVRRAGRSLRRGALRSARVACGRSRGPAFNSHQRPVSYLLYLGPS